MTIQTPVVFIDDAHRPLPPGDQLLPDAIPLSTKSGNILTIDSEGLWAGMPTSAQWNAISPLGGAVLLPAAPGSFTQLIRGSMGLGTTAKTYTVSGNDINAIMFPTGLWSLSVQLDFVGTVSAAPDNSQGFELQALQVKPETVPGVWPGATAAIARSALFPATLADGRQAYAGNVVLRLSVTTPTAFTFGLYSRLGGTFVSSSAGLVAVNAIGTDGLISTTTAPPRIALLLGKLS